MEKPGYQAIYDNAFGKVTPTDWAAFIGSTKQALTFHKPKVVAFKKDNSLVDCIHELIHVFQWTETGSADLAPLNREKTVDRILAQAELEVIQVEKQEKAKNIKVAKELAAAVQKKIDLRKELDSLTDTLDEVEAHYFILQNCDRLLCSGEDRETALANLRRLSDNLPAEIREQVNKEVSQLIQKKKEEPIKKANGQWKAHNAADAIKEVEGLLAKSWRELATTIKDAGISLVRIGEYDEKKALPFKDRIPNEFFRNLPEPNENEQQILKDSKILSGKALGKFVCQLASLERPFIVLTMDSTRGALIHEFLHYRQSQRNSDYCSAVFGQTEVARDFAKGKMDRSTHDQMLLYYQAINAIAEWEVYNVFLKLEKNFDRLENLNNQAMEKQFADWLGIKTPTN